MPNPKLLVLTPRFPYPILGGDVLRIYRLCEQLKKEWEITLVSVCQSRREMKEVLPVDSPFSAVHRIYLPKWRSYVNTILGALCGKSLQVSYYQSTEIKKKVAELSPCHDALLCHLARTAQYAESFSGIKILELTDHLPLTYKRSNSVKGKSGILRRMAYRIEIDRIQYEQERFASKFDMVSFVSDVDRNYFIQNIEGNTNHIITIGNGICFDDRKFYDQRSGEKIAFIGNMAAMPNSDAVMYFSEVVLPTLLKRYPGMQLKVIGPIGNVLKRRLERNKSVEVVGAVESIEAATRDCVLGVCPVRIGAGVQNKVLDYMALGLATITTSLGAEGIEGRPGEHFLVADTAEEFVDCITKVLQDDVLRTRLIVDARSVIDRAYSWPARTEILINTLRMHIGPADVSMKTS